MESIRSLFKVGRGPSSSHSMGPFLAAQNFASLYEEAECFEVYLYGSLAFTGKGHATDRMIEEGLQKPTTFHFCYHFDVPHPNTMDFNAYKKGKLLGKKRYFSIGGGAILAEGESRKAAIQRYDETSLKEIITYCQTHAMDFADYVFLHEDNGFRSFLREILQQMKLSIQEGISKQGELPGGLHILRKAFPIFHQEKEENQEQYWTRIVCAYAYAVAEENAAGGRIVTAPTCGASGVLPSVLMSLQEKENRSEEDILRALAVAGLFGIIIKQNASISGAECGCQAEIGSACAMTAAALAYLKKMDLHTIECCAEMAMEHFLGLTCDPVDGLVQIPCIERNAIAALNAIHVVTLAPWVAPLQKISFDCVLEAMRETGENMPSAYKETSEGGLAKKYRRSL